MAEKQSPCSAPICLGEGTLGVAPVLRHSVEQLMSAPYASREEGAMDRTFAGSMLIVGVYIAAASVMLVVPQLALYIIMH